MLVTHCFNQEKWSQSNVPIQFVQARYNTAVERNIVLDVQDNFLEKRQSFPEACGISQIENIKAG